MSPRDLGLCRPARAGAIWATVAALLVLVVLDGLWSSAVGERSISSPLAGVANESTPVIVLTGLVVAIVAPLAEELFFRGFLYRSLRSSMRIGTASAVAGVMFAIVHSNYRPSAMVPVAFFGVAACMLYERTGSLAPGIALHSFVDASGFELALTGSIVITPLVALAVITSVALTSLRRRQASITSGTEDLGRPSG